MLYILLSFLFIVITIGVMIPALSRHKKKQLKETLSIIKRLKPEVETAFADISFYYNYNHYITESERIALEEKYGNLAKVIQPILRTNGLDNDVTIESFKRFSNAMSDTSYHKTVNNNHFIENQLKSYSQYFDYVLAYHLDQQQREAVVSLEDNVLVISSA